MARDTRLNSIKWKKIDKRKGTNKRCNNSLPLVCRSDSNRHQRPLGSSPVRQGPWLSESWFQAHYRSEADAVDGAPRGRHGGGEGGLDCRHFAGTSRHHLYIDSECNRHKHSSMMPSNGTSPMGASRRDVNGSGNYCVALFNHIQYYADRIKTQITFLCNRFPSCVVISWRPRDILPFRTWSWCMERTLVCVDWLMDWWSRLTLDGQCVDWLMDWWNRLTLDGQCVDWLMDWWSRLTLDGECVDWLMDWWNRLTLDGQCVDWSIDWWIDGVDWRVMDSVSGKKLWKQYSEVGIRKN